jgi:hypothetical protein
LVPHELSTVPAKISILFSPLTSFSFGISIVPRWLTRSLMSAR